jgi:uncharacterized protein
MLKRAIEQVISGKIDFKKAIILLGPRQVGKTTLITKIAASMDSNYLYINGDDPAVRTLWKNISEAVIFQLIGRHRVVVIDEAQRIENIGLVVKMIVDAKKGIQVFVSGSSALELASTINEPLTGRKWEYQLYPIAWSELSDNFSLAKALSMLESLLVKGAYPEVINEPGQATEVLRNLAGSYLYKDILELQGIRRPELLLKLLQALAWQVGSEVSYQELAQTVGADKNTVSVYIDLLEKAFVVFRLQPFARNLRNEISTSRKIYFYDNGIRNTLINNYAPLSQRNDVGALWENFIISERKKSIAYLGNHTAAYFWRNVRKAEVDYIEELDGVLKAFELKWSPQAKYSFPKAFTDTYSPAEMKVIHRENFWQYL